MRKQTFRATYSKEGLDWLHPQNPDRYGDAYESIRYTYIRWDNCKTFTAYAKSFIRPIAREEHVGGWDFDFYSFAFLKKLADDMRKKNLVVYYHTAEDWKENG